MAKRVLFSESSVLSEAEERELQTLVIETKRTAPLTPESAYLKARDVVGGDGFTQARAELKRLDELDRISERRVNDYEESLERSARLGKFLPRNAILLRRLVLEHQNVRDQYNAAARRFEAHLNKLRTPAAREEIRKLAATLLTRDQTNREKVRNALLRVEVKIRRAAVSPSPETPVRELPPGTRRPLKIKL